MRRFDLLGALSLGAAFGAATSLSNDLGSGLAEVVSLILGAACAWASLAVVAGWLARTPARGAVAGVAALIAATTAYYGMDSVLREESLGLYWPEMVRWWAASVVFGAGLGAVGACIRRPGTVGLIAGLTIPLAAAAQMILLPPGSKVLVTPAMTWARAILWAAAAVCTALVVGRFLAERRLQAAGHPDRARPHS